MMKFKWISSLILVLLAGMAAGCGAQDRPQEDQGEVMTVFVGPELVDCEGEGPQKCMLVKESSEDDWHLFYDLIDGFDYEEGHNYEITVTVEEVPDPPAGGSSIRWVLVDVISKKPVEKSAETSSLEGAVWVMEEYRDSEGNLAPSLPETTVAAEFSDGKVSGSAGCNNYNSQYKIEGESITIGPIALTQMFCNEPEGIMVQEAQYLAALQNAATYTIELEQLNLFDAEGTRMVNYVARAEGRGVSGELEREFGIETFGNLEYKTTMTSSGTAQLQDGEYHEQVGEGSASETVVSLTGNFMYGELNDGSKAATAILTTTTGGSGTFYELALLQVQDGELVNVATTFLGDRLKILSLQIHDGQIIVEIVAQGADDPMCCPTQWLRKTFEYQGGELIETSSEELGKVSAPELLGDTWLWIRYVDTVEAYDVANPEDYTVQFQPDDTVNVKADCNMANGVYTASNGEIDIEILITTLAICAPDSLGDTFITHLNAAAVYYFEGPALFFDLPIDSGIMEFERGGYLIPPVYEFSEGG